MVCGKELLEPGSAQAAEFEGMAWEALELTGIQTLSDIFPILGSGNDVKDFLDVMLDLREDGTQVSLEKIKAILTINWIPFNNLA
ncbi:hypothetical protein SUGI_0349370 [Cryptomeria japonica]|nr:hypothetical protein SUGI_0349370 [Cryptomeria japonica]